MRIAQTDPARILRKTVLMSVSRVAPTTAAPVQEVKPKSPEKESVSQQKMPVRGSPGATDPSSAQQARFLARSEKTGSLTKPKMSAARTSKATTWNTGLSLACELVEAATTPDNETPGLSLHLLVDMIQPLAPDAKGPAPAVTDFIGNAISRLKSGGVSAQNAVLIQKLEELKANSEGDNALGFFITMSAMAAAARIAESIRTRGADDAGNRTVQHVEAFAAHVALLAARAVSGATPRSARLIAMLRAAMSIPFQYVHGKGMLATLSMSMMNWSREAAGSETKAARKELNDALGQFLDALIGPQEQ